MGTERKRVEYTNSLMEHLIQELVHSERDRSILHRRYIDGLTFDELSAEFNISDRHIKTIVHKYDKVLF